jgi:hypothetical protein
MNPAVLPFGVAGEENPYPSLSSYAPGGLVRLTPEGRVLHATSALAEMLGYADVKGLIGGNVIDLCTNPDDGRRLLLRL